MIFFCLIHKKQKLKSNKKRTITKYQLCLTDRLQNRWKKTEQNFHRALKIFTTTSMEENESQFASFSFSWIFALFFLKILLIVPGGDSKCGMLHATFKVKRFNSLLGKASSLLSVRPSVHLSSSSSRCGDLVSDSRCLWSYGVNLVYSYPLYMRGKFTNLSDGGHMANT